MAFSEDMSVFFDLDGFAVPASFTSVGGGAPVLANVIYDIQTVELMNGSLSNDATILYPASELAGIVAGDTGTVDSVSFRIRDIRHIDDGKLKIAKLTRI